MPLPIDSNPLFLHFGGKKREDLVLQVLSLYGLLLLLLEPAYELLLDF